MRTILFEQPLFFDSRVIFKEVFAVVVTPELWATIQRIRQHEAQHEPDLHVMYRRGLYGLPVATFARVYSSRERREMYRDFGRQTGEDPLGYYGFDYSEEPSTECLDERPPKWLTSLDLVIGRGYIGFEYMTGELKYQRACHFHSIPIEDLERSLRMERAAA